MTHQYCCLSSRTIYLVCQFFWNNTPVWQKSVQRHVVCMSLILLNLSICVPLMWKLVDFLAWCSSLISGLHTSIHITTRCWFCSFYTFPAKTIFQFFCCHWPLLSFNTIPSRVSTHEAQVVRKVLALCCLKRHLHCFAVCRSMLKNVSSYTNEVQTDVQVQIECAESCTTSSRRNEFRNRTLYRFWRDQIINACVCGGILGELSRRRCF